MQSLGLVAELPPTRPSARSAVPLPTAAAVQAAYSS